VGLELARYIDGTKSTTIKQESPGMILWNFLSLGLAGGQYIKHHRKLEENWWHWHQWQNQASRLAAQREKERLEETETEERLKPAGYD
jgi:hypothetical protein